MCRPTKTWKTKCFRLLEKHPTDTKWIQYDPDTKIARLFDPDTNTFRQIDPAKQEFVVGKDSKVSIVGHGSTSNVQKTLAGQTAVKIGHLIEGKACLSK